MFLILLDLLINNVPNITKIIVINSLYIPLLIILSPSIKFMLNIINNT